MTEREQFEVWAKEAGLNVIRHDNDHYVFSTTRGAWEGWQARAQPAQAVPVLTDDAIKGIADACDDGQEDAEYTLAFARRVEQAVRAKLGVAVPMTEAQIHAIGIDNVLGCCSSDLRFAVRAAERHHGIVGKEGA